MRATLTLPDGRFDRSAIMLAAGRTFRSMRGAWDSGRCQRFVWAKARAQRETAIREQQFLRATKRRTRFTRLDAAMAA